MPGFSVLMGEVTAVALRSNGIAPWPNMIQYPGGWADDRLVGASMKPKLGTGAFQWNAGGWFGSQLGSTLWLFILAGEMVPKSVFAATWLFVCAAAPNILGCILWMKRDRLAPYPAIQFLIAAIGAGTLVALLVADHFLVLASIDSRWKSSPRQAYWVLCIFPMLMAQAAWLERSASKRGKTRSA